MLANDSLVLDGRFRVLRPLGSGGMGEVYLGEQVSLGRKVAIKVLHHDLHAQAGMAERFKREARLLSAVEHPAVVRIVDFGESGDAACLVMEFVEGTSLHDMLNAGPLAPMRALPLLQQLAEGLAAIHDKGIIHRDLKPENVFVSQGGRGEQARLLDFGIARLVEPDAASNLSQIGVVLGTPEYLSPEQAVGARVDTRSDLYSFGVLCYRVLSGRLPFDGPAPRHYLAQHASAAPLPLDRAAPGLSRAVGLLALVMRLLEKDPSRRVQSAHELADALTAAHQALLSLSPATASPPSGSHTPASSTSMFGAGAAVPSPPSGTAMFGGAGSMPITPGSGTAVFGTTPAPAASQAPAPSGRSGTAAFGTRPSGSNAAVTGGSALVAKPQNLTVMLTDLQGFTERTSRQTHEENARMLETHDRLLLPLVREHDGRLIQKRGDALLVVFRSPTASVLCGMAMQDALWRHNQTVPAEQQLHVRVCLHAGEVLVTQDSVMGEPMEVVKAVEHVASAGEVTFTEAVNLARNRVEAPADPCGTIPLPGREEQLQLYRCVRAAEGAPFGERFASKPRPSPLIAIREQALAVLSAGVARARAVPFKELLRTLPGRLRELAVHLRRQPRQLGAVAGAAVLLVGGIAWVVHSRDAVVQSRALLAEGKPAEALKRLNALAEPEKSSPSVKQARAAAMHALGKHDPEHDLLATLGEADRTDVRDWVLDGLAEDFGESESDRGLRRLLDSLPEKHVLARFEDLAAEKYSARQWGALRYLEASQHTEGLNLVKMYSASLESRDCGVRARAARRLAALGDADAIPALTRLTEQPRDKGLLGLKSCGHDEAEDALRQLRKKSG
ncbi:protein kinase [Myxococcaceae bacterium JPH2]|nr:protein kinase [Myxococcaceae bacterium JPH2]